VEQDRQNLNPQTNVVVDAACDFFAPILNGDSELFRETLTDLCESKKLPYGRMLVAAGLIKAGFEFETEPELTVKPPDKNPSLVVPDELLRKNWHRWDGAIIELGMMATEKTRHPETYSQEIVDFVTQNID
jgi:hypothetical protein